MCAALVHSVDAMSSKSIDGLTAFLSSILASGFTFIFQIFVSRNLPETAYASYTLYFEVSVTMLMACDLGMGVTFINLYRREADRAPESKNALISLILLIKIGLFVFSLLAGLLFLFFSSAKIEGIPVISFALLCCFGEVLYQYRITILQAETNFRSLSLHRVLLPIVRLLLLLGAVATFGLSLSIVVLIYAISCLAVAIPIVREKLIKLPLTKREGDLALTEFPELWRLLKWNILSSLCAIFVMKADVLIVGALLSPSDISAYGAAQRFSMIGSVLTTACSTILIPLAVQQNTRAKIRAYLRRVAKYSSLFAAPLIIVLPFLGGILPMIMGSHFDAATVPAMLLVLSYSIGLVVSPLTYTFHSHGLSRFLTYQLCVQAIIMIVGGLIVVPIAGIIGAATLNLLTRLLGGVVIFYVFIYKIYLTVPEID